METERADPEWYGRADRPRTAENAPRGYQSVGAVELMNAIRVNVVRALEVIGTEAKQVVLVLTQLLEDESNYVHSVAEKTLKQIPIQAEAREDAEFNYWYVDLVN